VHPGTRRNVRESDATFVHRGRAHAGLACGAGQVYC